ncbi:MAG: dual specificity protein phosphatase family protein [Verrucomicrobia bacterium]|nr:dual specificity protein phosphatase family protein [Verrucomicrobiota bacterium]
MKLLALSTALASVTLVASEPAPAPSRARVRPAEWAAPVIETTLDNCYRVSPELFRCEQPAKRDTADLQALGIRTLLNLRQYHTDSADFARAGLTLAAEQMAAGKVSTDQLVAALRKFRAAPKPVLVHCWHGSDRTGAFVAAYRMVFQHWTPAAAIDELRRGGYGFHETAFPNLVPLLESLDVEAVRRRVNE